MARQNRILHDRKFVCFQITISFLPEITGLLSDKLKFSAGQNENLQVLSDSPAVFAKTVVISPIFTREIISVTYYFYKGDNFCDTIYTREITSVTYYFYKGDNFCDTIFTRETTSVTYYFYKEDNFCDLLFSQGR